MKQRQGQSTAFHQTTEARGPLRSIGITSGQDAAAAVNKYPDNKPLHELIRKVYGTTPEVRKALSRKSS